MVVYGYGHLKVENNIPRKIIISTDSFSVGKNIKLIEFLFEKYQLLFQRDNQNRIILYDQFQIHYFLFLITPYLHWSMHKKFLSLCDLLSKLPARRKTIYLPHRLKIKYPTNEINEALNVLDEIIGEYKNEKFYYKYTVHLLNRELGETKG